MALNARQNRGRASHRGTEVVQLYAADTATGLTLPAQQLIGFARESIWSQARRGTSRSERRSAFSPTREVSDQLVMEVRPGGARGRRPSSDIRSSAMLTVTGKARTIRGKDRVFLSKATGAQP